MKLKHIQILGKNQIIFYDAHKYLVPRFKQYIVFRYWVNYTIMVFAQVRN